MLLISCKSLLCTHNETIYVLRECQGPGLRNAQEMCGTSRAGIQPRSVKCQRCKSPGGTHTQGHASAGSPRPSLGSGSHRAAGGQAAEVQQDERSSDAYWSLAAQGDPRQCLVNQTGGNRTGV